MPNNAANLASALRQHKPTSASVGYPQWLRAKVGSYVRARRDVGTRIAELSSELGVSTTTLAKWARITKNPQIGGFAQVVAAPPLVSEALAPAPAPATVLPTPARPSTSAEPGPVHITSPRGFSLHGLSIEQAVAVFARLR